MLTIFKIDVNIEHVESKKRQTAMANVRSKREISKNKKISKKSLTIPKGNVKIKTTVRNKKANKIK